MRSPETFLALGIVVLLFFSASFAFVPLVSANDEYPLGYETRIIRTALWQNKWNIICTWIAGSALRGGAVGTPFSVVDTMLQLDIDFAATADQVLDITRAHALITGPNDEIIFNNYMTKHLCPPNDVLGYAWSLDYYDEFPVRYLEEGIYTTTIVYEVFQGGAWQFAHTRTYYMVCGDVITIAIRPVSQEGCPGTPLQYNVDMFNGGPTPTEITLKATDVAGWELSFEFDNFILEDIIRSKLFVHVPYEIEVGATDNITVTATDAAGNKYIESCAAEVIEPPAPWSPDMPGTELEPWLPLMTSLAVMVGLGIVGLNMVKRGNDPIPAILMAFAGLLICWTLGWVPDWVLFVALAGIGLIGAKLWIKLFGRGK